MDYEGDPFMIELLKFAEVLRKKVINDKEVRKYGIVKFIQTIMEGVQPGSLVRAFFRDWNVVKEERKRKLALDETGKKAKDFDIYRDSWFDYPIIVASKLGGTWGRYNRHIAIHSPACTFNCWHCYVEEELKNPAAALKKGFIEFVTADQIIDGFFEQQKIDKEREMEDYVLRFTGGEPFLMPDLILEILSKIKDMGKDDEIFIWTETNIVPFLKERTSSQSLIQKWVGQDALDEFAQFRNFCIHPCLHGISPSNFYWITKAHPKYFEGLLNGIRTLIEYKLDIYPTFGSNVSQPEMVPYIFERLIGINDNLPLRFALIDYELDCYKPAVRRITASSKPRQIYNKILVIDKWDKLLKQTYGVGYAEKPRHEVKL